MTTRTTAALLRRHVHGLQQLTEGSPSGRVVRAGSLAFADAGIDVAAFNAIAVTGAAWSVGDLDRAAALAATSHRPWSITVQLGTGTVRDAARLRAVERVAERHGLTERDEDPFLACRPADFRPATPVADDPAAGTADGPVTRTADGYATRTTDGPAVRTAGRATFGVRRTGRPHVVTVPAADWREYTEVVAAGFEVPPATFGTVFGGALLDDPTVTGYLVRVDGRTVGSGLGVRTDDALGVHNVAVRTDDALGVHNVAVLPADRGHGAGRAVTERAVRDGFAAGATAAFLVSSPDGLPLYRSLGFRHVDTLVRWSAPEPATDRGTDRASDRASDGMSGRASDRATVPVVPPMSSSTARS
ncbi:GNAT family N-acetyltransferase [Curtobacterium sp. L1-20]|uniref:GNAT family N-acetyltransferase n=1 Tax=Curtobacterium sp. L1-20 TaxID=3138181 RepID=UPI003B519F9E